MSDLILRPDDTRERTIHILWRGAGEVYLDPGDGTGLKLAGRGSVQERAPMTHTYATVGAYTVTARRGDGELVAQELIFVRPSTAIDVAWAPGSDNPNFIDFTFGYRPSELLSRIWIDYGDGSTPETLTAPAKRSHGYKAGAYTVKLRDEQARRAGVLAIEVHDPVYDPDFQVTQGSGRNAVVAEITRLEATGKDVLLDWGDGYQTTIPAAEAAVGVKREHTYDVDNVYIIQCVYADGSTDGSARDVTIPWPARGSKPTSTMYWIGDASSHLGILAKWIGAISDYTLHWGDGTSERVRWQQPPVKHAYPSPGTYRLTAVADLNTQVTMSADVVIREQMTPVVEVRHVAGMKVWLVITDPGAPRQHLVTWGDGSPPVTYGDELSPEYTYPAGVTRPKITVVDVPARRIVRLTGPDLSPDPPSGMPTVKGGVREATVTFGDNAATGLWRIKWPDWDEEQELTVTALPHTETRPVLPGAQQITVTHVGSGQSAVRDATVDVGWQWDTDYAIEVDGLRARVKLLAPLYTRSNWRIQWGDASTSAVDGAGAWSEWHTYAAEEEYIGELYSSPPNGGRVYTRVKRIRIGTARTERLRLQKSDSFCFYTGEWVARRGWYAIDWGDGGAGSGPTAVHPDLPAWRWFYSINGNCTPGKWTVTVHPMNVDGSVGPVAHEGVAEIPKWWSKGKWMKKETEVSHRPPYLVTESYVNAGATVHLRLLNIPTGFTKAAAKSGLFRDGYEHLYDMTIVDDSGSTTGKSGIVEVPIASDAEPGEAQVEIVFPEWEMTIHRRIFVDDVTADPAEPINVELIPVDERGMHTLRVTQLSRNRAVPADAATTLPPPPGDARGKSLEDWFGLIGDPATGGAHANITVDPKAEGDFVVRVKQWFHAGNGTYTYVIKDANITIVPKPPKPIPGGEPFILKKAINTTKLGDNKFIRHEVLFGEDHTQPNTDYGYAINPSITPRSGSENDLTEDVIAAMRQLASFKINPRQEKIIFYSGNPAFLKNNTAYDVGYRIMIVPTKQDDGVSASADDAHTDV